MRVTIVVAILVGMFGCEKQVPYPITKAHIEKLAEIADRTASFCDGILENPDCYHAVDGDSTPDAPSVPRPLLPFEADPLFKGLGMGCHSKTDIFTYCNDRPDGPESLGWPILCDWKDVWLHGKRDTEHRGKFEQVSIPTKPECAGAWGGRRMGVLRNRTTP